MFRFGLFNNNFSEEELEAARLRYVIASLPIGMIKTLPEPIMEDVIRNTTTRNIEVLKTFIIDNLPENLKNRELIEMYPDYINKLTSSERIHLYRKLYGDSNSNSSCYASSKLVSCLLFTAMDIVYR